MGTLSEPRRRTGIPRICQQCGDSFLARPLSVRQGEGKYCSRACSVKSKVVPVWDRLAPSLAFGVPSAHRPDLGPCWLSTMSQSGGYAKIRVAGSSQGVHRAVYEKLIGPVPPGLDLDHLCRVRNCVCPFHLEPVLPRTNKLRGVGIAAINAAKTHCLRGHAYAEDSTSGRKAGAQRRCRACRQVLRDLKACPTPEPAAVEVAA